MKIQIEYDCGHCIPKDYTLTRHTKYGTQTFHVTTDLDTKFDQNHCPICKWNKQLEPKDYKGRTK